MGTFLDNIIITGANGFIGRKLTEFYAEKGSTVYALVYGKTGIFSLYNNVKEISFDFQSISKIKEKLPFNASTLYHLAWAGVSTSVKNDSDIQLRNVGYGLEILKLAYELSVQKVIYPGSISEYAYSGEIVTGHNIPNPSDFYSVAKIATHFACDLYARQNNMCFIWVLISSIYGPGRDDNNLITYTIKSLLKGDKPSFTKLEQLWDYIYIDDLISALYCVGSHGKNGAIYPIGSGEHKSLLEYVLAIRDMINGELELGVGEIPYKTQAIDNSIVDISRLREETGFEPKYTFECGIRKTIDYFTMLHENGQ